MPDGPHSGDRPRLRHVGGALSRIVMRILVTGATGTVGSHVLRHLLDRGHDAVAAVRQPAGRDLPDGAGRVAYDVTRPETFGPALAGADALFLMLPPGAGGDLKAVVDAAEAAGVGRIAYLSVQGADRNSLLPHRAIEKRLEDGTAQALLVRASYFMQNLSEVHVDDVRQGEIAVPAGRGATSFVDARDVAEVAAAWLAGETPTLGTGAAVAIEVTGPEALDYFEVAAILSDVLDRRIVYTRPGAVEFFRHERDKGCAATFAGVMTGLYTSARLGLADTLADGVERALQRPARSTREFAEDYREVWV